MKPFALLIAGVIVGLAASDVDWSREALGQDALIDAPPSTLQGDVPDAPPQPTSRGVFRETNPPKADGILDPSIPRPRRVYETHVITDSNGARHTEVVSRLVNADGSIVPDPEPGLIGRFQASAYGSPNGHGCYIVDTMTGKTWHVTNGQLPQVVVDSLIPSAIQPTLPAHQPAYGPPSQLYPQVERPVPQPELAEPEPDDAE